MNLIVSFVFLFTWMNMIFYYISFKGPSWLWSYVSWIYNYLCNYCLSPLTVVSSNPIHSEVYSMQQYGIKFVSNLRQVGGFLWVVWFPPPIKLDCHDITEILLKVALNIIKPKTRKIISWSVTVYNKYLSSQCNLTVKIEPVQDKMNYQYNKL